MNAPKDPPPNPMELGLPFQFEHKTDDGQYRYFHHTSLRPCVMTEAEVREQIRRQRWDRSR